MAVTAAIGALRVEPAAAAPCDIPDSVACENQQAGNPSSEWQISGAGDARTQGFATDFSVTRGTTVQFKIMSDAPLNIDIYRLGFYNGLGARKWAGPIGVGVQSQPPCSIDGSNGLVDCGNWSVSASWAVPSNAVSGVFVAVLKRTGGGASHILFVVRKDDGRKTDLLVQTDDTTWVAYNRFPSNTFPGPGGQVSGGGVGNSLYSGTSAAAPGRAVKVSYNRPLTIRASSEVPQTNFFRTMYPFVRWTERNGFDMAYQSGVDTDRLGAGPIAGHKAFVSVGHDEYWSHNQRLNVENARNGGVSLAFFTGNTMFWKTRYENSFRTLVSYKDTITVTPPNTGTTDPTTWTGTWRDPRCWSQCLGAENAVTGTLFNVNGITETNLTVPDDFAPLRFWRNTSVAALPPGGVANFGPRVLGYEWDDDIDNGLRPAGLIHLSRTINNLTGRLIQNFGASYLGSGISTHSLTLYRAPSGALVFSTGSINWDFALDDVHDGPPQPVLRDLQQATLNLLVDMGAQPVTKQSDLVAASPSTDGVAPSASITSDPNVPANSSIVIAGTASDAGGGRIGAVEVSTDNGATWHLASGHESWSYPYTTGAANTSPTVRARAVDDSGNIGTAAAQTLNVGGAPPTTTTTTTAPPINGQTLWPNSTIPGSPAEFDGGAVELGVKLQVAVAGRISAIRFYKGIGNNGTHVGHLWRSDGTLLSAATFTNESSTGWQTVTLPTPIDVVPGVTYLASYFAPFGHYAFDAGYFNTARVNGSLTAPSNATSGGNGVFVYGANGGFPNQSNGAANYWVDVVFNENGGGSSTTTTGPSTGTTTGSTTGTTTPTTLGSTPPTTNDRGPLAPSTGYWLVASDGGIFSYGDAAFYGSTGAIKLNQPIVGMAPTPSGKGYWLVASDGGIFSYGDAAFHGSTGAIRLNKPIVGMASTPSGKGYWLVASDGGIFAFGDAAFYGSTGDIRLASPIVGMTARPSGNGYWFIAADGGVFAFGDAPFLGSAATQPKRGFVTGLAATPSGAGYWVTTLVGEVLAYGDATKLGDLSAQTLTAPIIGIASSRTGLGYWLYGTDGSIRSFGDAPLTGSPASLKINHAIKGMVSLP